LGEARQRKTMGFFPHENGISPESVPGKMGPSNDPQKSGEIKVKGMEIKIQMTMKYGLIVVMLHV